ncbi:MAG: hypothetical protein KDB27_16110 [Planctomycetales bacterium]|nr:hypothetical protein [Planctomycetales bacterium]
MRYQVCSSFACLLVFIAGCTSQQQEVNDPPPGASLSSGPQTSAVQSNSCASGACHGDTSHAADVTSAVGSEFTFYVSNDPHAQSFRPDAVLWKQILSNLGAAGDSTVEQQCVACHLSSFALHDEQDPAGSTVNGIGCEHCHGAAEAWIDKHYTSKWRDNLPQNYSASNMTQISDHRVQARLCVSCHVGTPDNEVNHDMIAAGHPALMFEVAGYLELLPRHWNNQKQRKNSPEFELSIWANGQIATTSAAVELLKARTQNAKPWPEFAEYDCVSCHHSLSLRNLGSNSNRSGIPPWGSWHSLLTTAGLDRAMFIPSSAAASVGGGLSNSMRELRSGMQDAAFMDVKRVPHALLDEVLSGLSEWKTVLDASVSTSGQENQPIDFSRLMNDLLEDEVVGVTGANSASATQYYLAMHAIHQSLYDAGKITSNDGATANALLQLRTELEEGYDAVRFKETLLPLRSNLEQLLEH